MAVRLLPAHTRLSKEQRGTIVMSVHLTSQAPPTAAITSIICINIIYINEEALVVSLIDECSLWTSGSFD